MASCNDLFLQSTEDGFYNLKCISCRALHGKVKPFFDLLSKQCVSEDNCPKWSIPESGNEICKNCKKQKKFLLAGHCHISNCEKMNADLKDSNTNFCDCKTDYPYFVPGIFFSRKYLKEIPKSLTCIKSCKAINLISK